MSIASEITKLNTNLTNSYTACSNKGATMPTDQNFDNLATCISSIQTGGGGSTLITKNITQNGTYNASSDNADGYSSVTVNVSGGSFTGINREVVNGVYQMPASSFTFSLPSTATNVGQYAMQYAFQGCTGLTSVDLSGLTSVSDSQAMYYAFYNCTGITGTLDLSSLTTVSGRQALQYVFEGCTGLTSVDLSGLTSVSDSQAMCCAFYGCTGLTGALNLSSLTTVSGSSAMGSAFYGCTGLTSVDLSSLTTVSGGSAMQTAFRYCTNLASINFNSLQTIGDDSSSSNYGHFSSCFNNCNNLTTLTFTNLKKIYCTGGTSTSYGTFASNNKVQKMYFPKLNTITYGSGASNSNKNACKNVFYGCSALTELHFGSANQSAIQATAGYSTAWGRGAGNVTIYFDL